MNEQAALANQFFKNGEYEKALSIYDQLYHTKNGDQIFYQEYINTLLKLKKFDEAEKIIKKKIRENPKYKIDLGQLYLEKGDNHEANKIFDAVLDDMPANQMAISETANSFYAIGNYDYAIKTFLTGRKILKDEDIFGYELINLYRFKRIKDGLTIELLKLITQHPEFLQMAKNNISRTFENEDDYNFLKIQLLKRIQKDPQNTNYIDLLAWQYIQQKQFDLALIQIIALDKRNNDDGGRVYALGNILIENKVVDAATKAFDYLINKGEKSSYYIPAKVALLRLKNQQVLDGNYQPADIQSLVDAYNELLDQFGRNFQTAFAIRQLAHLKAFYQNKFAEAEDLLTQAINYPGLKPETQSEIKLDLADIYVSDNQRWEAALLYGQVEKSFSGEPLGQKAKFKNAKLSFYNGDFAWAKAQLDVLKASTSQLIANDALDLSLLIQENLANDSTGNALKLYAKADLLQYKNQNQQAILTLDSVATLYPQNDLADDILMMKANIYIKQKDYNKASESFQKIIANYSYGIWADDALFKLATLEEDHLNDKVNAQKHYEELIEKFPGSLFVIEARKRFRNLRGDSL
ncbi:MAG: tetratricopeptide repeat protein [Sphingobacteriales bacterium]|nr:tetratricopeptide repeat protein [Sphingobacteriales bacterium]